MPESSDKHWTVGELANASGLTVRALHHYDELGLLVPAQRSSAGYRLYSNADVHRLYRIIALRRLGLPLDEIGAALEAGEPDLRKIVSRQLQSTEHQLEELRGLHVQLAAIRASLDRQESPSIEQLITTMEAIAVHEKYYTPEQLQQLRARGEQLGEEEIAAAEREWTEVFAALREEMHAGTDPAESQLDPYRERSRELLKAFTGGDPAIAASMRQMWDAEDPAQVSHGLVDRELFDYARRVFSAGGGITDKQQ